MSWSHCSRYVAILLLLLPILDVAIAKPNIVILLADDLGFGDIGPNGNDTINTPNLDRLAKSGLRFGQHLTAAPVCTPSRAALLTGRYPIRMGMVPSNRMQVIPFSASQAGIPPDEHTFAKAAQSTGYSTGLIGKWHLGVHCSNTKDWCHHPNNMGFQYFYGCLLTLLKDFSDYKEAVFYGQFPNLDRNLMIAIAVAFVSVFVMRMLGLLRFKYCFLLFNLTIIICACLYAIPNGFVKYANSIIHRQTTVVEQPIRFERLTQRLVWEGTDFIDKAVQKNEPFLLFMSYLQVHSPMYNSVPGFYGRSKHGWYGDNVEELDWSVGQILDALDERGLTNNTIVYFSSDNGGHLEEKDHLGARAGGHNGIYRGGKCQGSVDGGIRVPGILRWPGVVPSNSFTDQLTSQMDIYPTLLSAIGGNKGKKPIDGKDLTSLIKKPTSAKSPHQFLFQYCGNSMHAIRWNGGKQFNHAVFKLRLASPNWMPGTEGCRYVCDCFDGSGSTYHDIPLLFNLSDDPRESKPIDAASSQYKTIKNVMMQAKEQQENGIESVDSQFTLRKCIWRPWLQDCCNFPRCNCRDASHDHRPEVKGV